MRTLSIFTPHAKYQPSQAHLHANPYRLLIENGANITAVNMDKQTALDVAVESEDPNDDVIKCLKQQFSQKGM